MTTFYKILALCIGIALPCGLLAQNHLDPFEDNIVFQSAAESSRELLTPKHKCAIMVLPSFSTEYGISLSNNCDSLTLIGKNSHISLNGKKHVKFTRNTIAIDPVYGQGLAELIDVAVDNAMPTYSSGLDGVSYFFCATNGSVARTWSPKYSNCGQLANIAQSLIQTIESGDTQYFNKEWLCSLGSLKKSFKNAPPLPPFYFGKELTVKNNQPAIEYFSFSPLSKAGGFGIILHLPAEEENDSITPGMIHIESYNEIDSLFIDFSKSIAKWVEDMPVCFISADIIISDDEEEKYSMDINRDRFGHTSVKLLFTLPLSKLTIDNLLKENDNCIDRFIQESAATNEAEDQQAKPN